MMGLLTPGYFQSTFFPANYWNDRYWQSYGLVTFKREKITRDSMITTTVELDSMLNLVRIYK